MTSRDLDLATNLARKALDAHPAGLVTDLDGTIAPIVPDPLAARPLPRAVALLSALSGRLSVVAVVTGRSASDARRMLGPDGDGLLIVGNHGLEWLAAGSDVVDALAEGEAVRALLEPVISGLQPIDGVTIDDKGLSATIHYRQARDPRKARAEALASLADLPPGLEMREGRRSLELRPIGFGDKGSAVIEIARRHALAGLVVAGDDVTDLDMFEASAALGSRGAITTSIAIAGGGEVPTVVRMAADATVASPAAFVELLERLSASLVS